MMAWLSRLRLRGILALWGLYWVALAAVIILPMIGPLWDATHAPPDQGEFTVNFDGGAFTLVVKLAGRVLYSGSMSVIMLALLIAVPPLLLEIAWILSRRQPHAANVAR